MAIFPPPAPFEPAAPAAAPALTTPEVPPVVGVGSPWAPANGENRDRILDWWRSWWVNTHFPWVDAWSAWWGSQWAALASYLNAWVTDASAYITANAIQGVPGPNTLPADTAVAGFVSGVSLTQTALDARFRIPAIKDTDGTPHVVTDANYGAGDNWWNVAFNQSPAKIGYGMHLTSSQPNVKIIGVGVDTIGSTGILVSQKDGGGSRGIYLDHQIAINDPINDTTAYGFHGTQASTAAPLMFLESAFGGSAPLLTLKASTWGYGQVLFNVVNSDGSVASKILAEDGSGHHYAAQKFAITDASAGGFVFARTGGGRESLHLYKWTGAGTIGGADQTYYRFVIRGEGAEMVFGVADAGTATNGNETYTNAIRIDRSGASNRIGFFGTAPAARPGGTPAAATDLATVIALTNNMRAGLLSLGLVN